MTPTTTTVYRGPRFQIERRSFADADPPVIRDVVVHPGSAVIVPLLDDGRVVLIRNYRAAIDRELLELPAGTLDPPESVCDCAARELAEETGYRAAALTLLLALYPSPGILSEHMHVFLATGLTPGPTAHEAGEQIQVAPLPLDQALALIRDGGIDDGKTVAALLYYDRFRRPPRTGTKP